MNDPAAQLLATSINAGAANASLWVVDENLADDTLRLVQASQQLRAITNRIDIRDRLRASGIDTELSDFLFSDCQPASLERVYFRVGKEKAIVHHVLNRCADLLRVGGELHLIGGKNEGIKTYLKKAGVLLGGEVEQTRAAKAVLLGRIRRGQATGDPLDDRHYQQAIELQAITPQGEAISLASKPGVYGWNKIDEGSQVLVDTLPAALQALQQPPQTVLDLGCGYGYLAVMASTLLPARFIATDNNCAATAMCRANFASVGVRGEVVLADCAGGIDTPVELVLCNPPFHRGFTVQSGLTERFLAAARRQLRRGGQAIFVVNSFIPLERLARAHFADVEVLVNTGSFKVIRLVV